MTTIKTKKDYLKLFEVPVGNKETLKEALFYALDIRKFEIELYWKRAAYFWTFIGATFAGYFAIAATENISNDLLFLISTLGFLFSFAWFMVNRGSKFWQVNWETHVDLLEDEVFGPLYKTTLDARSFKWWEFHKEYNYSVSKINQMLSIFVTLVWVFLMIRTINEIISFYEPVKNFNIWLLLGYIVLCSIILHKYGKGSPNASKKEPKFILREYVNK